MGQIVTNQFGEASLNLAAGDYFLREIIPPAGFAINTDRQNFTIIEGQILSMVILNTAEPIYTPLELGRLLVTVISGSTDQRIPYAAVTLHSVMTDERIEELRTDQFGEASLFFTPGSFFIRQMHLPDGYMLNHDRIPVTIRSGEMTDIMIVARAIPTPSPTPAPQAPRPTPAPPTITIPPGDIVEDLAVLGRLEIITRAERSGNRLSGGLFAIYRLNETERVAQITTGAGGMATIELEPGQYFVRELRPTFGFLLEDTRILVDVAEGRMTQINLTKIRDWEIADLDLDPDTYGSGIIYIVQTGQAMSMLHYGGGGLLIAVSVGSAGLLVLGLLTKRKRNIANNSSRAN
jgi:uncharacterized surface anchored protein